MGDRWEVREGGSAEVLTTLEAHSVDALICDPPAGIGFMSAKWDGDKGGRDQWIAWLAGIMREARRVCKPGAHALVWALPRTSHWTATAMEDAGWAIRDICHHLFFTGFPKSKWLDEARTIGTAMKPAAEHWLLCRAPLEGTATANYAAWGTGGLQVDACRITGMSTMRSNRAEMGYHGGNLAAEYTTGSDQGRWPANLVLSCCGEDPHTDSCPVRMLDEQAGVRSSGMMRAGTPRSNACGYSGAMPDRTLKDTYGDSGGASRFIYVAKATAGDRDFGLEGMPATPATDRVGRQEGSAGMQSPRAGAGRTGGAKNHHPTLKSTTLMAWMVRLITPPDGLVLDCFAGSGSTGIAAIREGHRFIGIEQDPAFVSIARKRIGAAAAQGTLMNFSELG